MSEVSGIIQEMAKAGTQIQTCPAKVIRINRENNNSLHDAIDTYTIDVMRPDGAEIKKVRLKASIQDKDEAFICVPKENSWVLISIIETTETRAFVSQYSEIERVFLRIKRNDTQYFQMLSDGEDLELLYKGSIASTVGATAAEYKEIAKLNFKDDRSLNIQYFDDSGENKVQETTIAHDKVEVNFNEGEGYKGIIKSDFIQLTRGELDFQLTNEEKILMQKGDDNLKTQLDMLIDEISKIVVVQGTSPNIGNLNTIKTTIGNILQ